MEPVVTGIQSSISECNALGRSGRTDGDFLFNQGFAYTYHYTETLTTLDFITIFFLHIYVQHTIT